jgi:DNA polymerase-3 subunit alpha
MDCFGYHRSQLLAVYDQIMDSVAHTRKRTLDGQMGMFDLLDQDETAISIPIPDLAEMNKVDLMQLEKETTGIYLTGHPMDDYRKYLKYTHVLPMIQLMGEENSFKDDQIVSVAGIVQNVKMKTTRNNSMMAYVTVEDDTASMEMLAFSNVLQQYGGYIKENSPVVVTGRMSIRDEKEPQIVINRVRSILDFEEAAPQETSAPATDKTLWLKLPSEADPIYRKVRAIVNMFPGENPVKLFFADTRKIRVTHAALDNRMLLELRNVLGEAGVVVK